MKYVKMLGLAAVAAMALMAFLGASSASATVLCTTTPTPGTSCGAGWHVDEITASLVNSAPLRNTSGSLQATCTGSTITVTKKSTGSATTTPVGTVEKTELAWTECAQTTDTLAGGELEVHQDPTSPNPHDGTVTAKGFEVTVVIAGVSCIFGAGAGTDIGTLTGGEPAVIHVNAVFNKLGGSFLCPSDAVWEGTYQITNHKAVYVVES